MSRSVLVGAYDSHAAFYRDVYGHVIRETRPAGRTGAVMIYAEQGPGDWSDAPSPDLVVAVLARHSVDATIDVGAGSFEERRCRAGDFVVVPPNVATTFRVDGPHDIRFIAVPYAALMGLAGQDCDLPAKGDFGRLHTGMQRDRQVNAILEGLWVESARGSPHGALWADGTILQLAAALLRLRDEKPAAPARGGLAPWQLERIQNHLADRLHEDVLLADLAASINLSPYHFARAFKASTGLPPHRYQMMLRIQRAKELLAGTRQSITEIAYTCGFASSQHMATVFRRFVGATPSAYRRERLS